MRQKSCACFSARGDESRAVATAADDVRRAMNGETVSYVVTRNINYTNICYFKCRFCAFSKGKTAENLRGRPYNLALTEIATRARKRGSAAPPKSACRAAFIRITPARPIWRSAAR